MSRRDALTLAAAGLAAPLLPAVSFAETRKETNPMSYIKVGQENSQPIEIYYEDHGSGSPVVLIPWLAVERRRVGEADRRAARSRPSRDHV